MYAVMISFMAICQDGRNRQWRGRNAKQFRIALLVQSAVLDYALKANRTFCATHVLGLLLPFRSRVSRGTIETMEAAKRKTFWLLWIALAILLGLPVPASGVDVSHLKTRAELSCENRQFSVGPSTFFLGKHVENYDPFWGPASDFPVAPIRGIAGTRGLQHSFDRHAAEWFARHGGTPSLAKWQELLETAARSSKVVDWSTGADKTIGHLARIDGNKWFFVQFFKEGPRAGEVATAFIPNKDQLRAILELLGK